MWTILNPHLGLAARYSETVMYTQGAPTLDIIWEMLLGSSLGAWEACDH